MFVNRTAGGTGSVADKITMEKELRRTVLACMLWENLAYENGDSVAKRIKKLVAEVRPEIAAKIAVEARQSQKLRHAPLLIVREMARTNTHKHLVAQTLSQVIQRPDEITEFLSLYWAERKEPLSHQVKKGLAAAFRKFDEYQLAKYNGGSGEIKLRDALFLCHAKPEDAARDLLWKKLVNNELQTPDTWEVALSVGKESKTESWTRLLTDRKLGAMALLRNLRNMRDAGVDEGLIRQSLLGCNPDKVLPFRFISAVREVPQFKKELEILMLKCLKSQEKLKGKTVVIVDVSGSMGAGLSGKSTLNRMDAAIALAMLIKGVSEECSVYATAGSDSARKHKTERVTNGLEGFALSEEIGRLANRLGGGGIFLKQCVDFAMENEKTADTLVVISDSQDTSGDESPKKVVPFGKFNYMMDISCHQYGIAYNKFQVLNGFSEALVDYVIQDEKLILGENQ